MADEIPSGLKELGNAKPGWALLIAAISRGVTLAEETSPGAMELGNLKSSAPLALQDLNRWTPADL